MKIEDLGRVKRVRIDRDTTTLVEGGGKSSEIQGRVRQLRHQIAETTSDYDREKLKERLARLAGGVAVVKVGAATETEMKEKKARVEDALHATHTAVEEGILPGGDVALLRVRAMLGDAFPDNLRHQHRRVHRGISRAWIALMRTTKQTRRGGINVLR